MGAFFVCFSALKLQDVMQEATMGFCAAALCVLYVIEGFFCLLMANSGQRKVSRYTKKKKKKVKN